MENNDFFQIQLNAIEKIMVHKKINSTEFTLSRLVRSWLSAHRKKQCIEKDICKSKDDCFFYIFRLHLIKKFSI